MGSRLEGDEKAHVHWDGFDILCSLADALQDAVQGVSQTAEDMRRELPELATIEQERTHA